MHRQVQKTLAHDVILTVSFEYPVDMLEPSPSYKHVGNVWAVESIMIDSTRSS